ncbi:hypothetical protein L6452_34104 [Arctium lappa]|uniref:Uncharacterized protein n=1 Tax=Arctium lappa TaxID=4217 RepID=A0ACB8YGM9_ARCLA|nr:hypothetical protein L6452_34104 [Arctium lappa]
MDSYDFVDSVKAEKANALARYKRFTNLSKLLQFIEVFVAVVLISWSSTRLPLVLKISGEYLVAFSSYLMNQHVVFLVGNVIVVVCYVLSRRSEAGSESGGSGIYYGEQKYNHQKTTVDAPKAKPVVESPITRQAAVTESRDRMITNEKAIMKTESEVAAEAAIKQAAKQIERFQRTQSDKLKSQISMKSRRELRRSVTERRNGELTSTSVQAVERLSNEEFRIAVEAFISKQQSFLKQQSMVDNGS